MSAAHNRWLPTAGYTRQHQEDTQCREEEASEGGHGGRGRVVDAEWPPSSSL
jgi:hypothetical protein